MKIALIGFGKMGHEIARQAEAQGEQIVATFDVDPRVRVEALAGADVCIDFSVPSAAVDNMKIAAEAGVDIVVGTTGWYDRLDEVGRWFEESAMLYAQNFSIGVNVFYRIIRSAAALMDSLPEYDVYIEEMHHRHKLDSPSGTASRIGEILLGGIRRKTRLITEPVSGAIAPEGIHVCSVRSGQIAGIHTVGFDSAADTIVLRHTAKSRTGFALGALTAARWVRGRKGVYTMDDVDL